MDLNFNFEIEKGSTGDNVGNIAELIFQATSEQGLTNTVNGLLNYAESTVTSAFLVEEALVGQLQALVEGSDEWKMIQTGVDHTNNVIALMKQALDIVMKGSNVVANITDICGTKPEGMAVPCVKEVTKAAYASYKQKLMSVYDTARLQAIDLYNSLIVTSCDSTTDNIVTSVNNILDLVEPQLDPVMKEYTGYTIAEVKYMTTLGIQYIRMFQRLCKLARDQKTANDEAESEENARLALMTPEERAAEEAAKKEAKETQKQAEKEEKEKQKLANKEAREKLKEADKTAKADAKEQEAKEKEEKKAAKEEAKKQWVEAANQSVMSWWETNKSNYALSGKGFTLTLEDNGFIASYDGTKYDLISDTVNEGSATRQISKQKMAIQKAAKLTYNNSYNFLLAGWEEEYDAKLAETKKALENEGEEIKDELADDYNSVITNITSTATSVGENIKETAVQEYKNLAKDLTKEEVTEKLLAWLNKQSLALLNAFHIFIIKDMIDGIKEKCDSLSTSSITSFADFVNACSDVFAIYELLGITKDALGLTVDDLKALGVAAIGTVKSTANNIVATANSIADLAEELGKSMYDTTIDSAKDMATNAQTSATGLYNSTIDGVGNLTTSLINNAKDAGTDAVSSLKDSAMSNANGALDSLKSIGLEGANSILSDNLGMDVSDITKFSLTVSLVISSNGSDLIAAAKTGDVSQVTSLINQVAGDDNIVSSVLNKGGDSTQLIMSLISNVDVSSLDMNSILNLASNAQSTYTTVSGNVTSTVSMIKDAKEGNTATAILNTLSSNNQQEETKTALIDKDEFIKLYKEENGWINLVENAKLQAEDYIKEVSKFFKVDILSTGFPQYVYAEDYNESYIFDTTVKEHVAEKGWTCARVFAIISERLKCMTAYKKLDQFMEDAESAYMDAEEAAHKLASLEDEYAGETFKMDPPEYDDDGNLNVKVILYSIPDNKALISYLDENYKSNKKSVFNNATKKTIQQNLEDIWDSGINNSFTVTGKCEKVTRKYNFNVTINSTAKLKYDEKQKLLANTQVSTSKSSVSLYTQEGLAVIASAGSEMLSDATDMAKSTASNMYGLAKSMATGAISNVTDGASGIATDAMASAQATSLELLLKSMQGAQGMLDSIDVTIDLSAIESILAGKVMMYDPVVQFLKVLMPVFDILAILCHLQENYTVNKKKVEQKAHIGLAKTLKEAYHKIIGLKDVLALDETNVFTVRTEKLATWCKETFNITPDDAGIAIINIGLTVLLNSYLATHYKDKIINGNNELALFKKTTLYFDGYGIENGGYEDGTYNGIDNFVLNADLGEIYYDAQGRSTMTSLIHRAISKKEDPYNVSTAKPEVVIDPLEQLINDLAIDTDEMEGTQALDLNITNLCIDELHDDEDNDTTPDDIANSSASLTIIEFGDEYTMGERTNYILNVKPGDLINKDTIIAYVGKDGLPMQPLKSTFDSGIVKSTADGDYFRVYPESSDRHIVLENAIPGQGNDYDAADVSAMVLDFSDSGEIFTMIVNNMCYSALPFILTNNRKRSLKATPTTISNYEDFVETYEKIIDEYSLKIQDKSSADSINSTNGNPNAIKSIGDSIVALRNEMLDKIVDLYMNYMPNNITSIGDKTYADCARLAYADGKVNIENFAFNEEPYNNYYINLLCRVNLSSDSKYVKEYYDLLSDIVAERNTLENYSIDQTVAEFNTLYLLYINDKQLKAINPYKIVDTEFSTGIPEYKDVYEFIKRQIIYANSTEKARLELSNLEFDTDKFTWYNTQEETVMKEDNLKNLYSIAKLLANIYVYIKTQSLKERTILTVVTNGVANISLATMKNIFNLIYKEYVDVAEEEPMVKASEIYEEIIAYAEENTLDPKYVWSNKLDEIAGKNVDNEISEKLFNLYEYIIKYEDDPAVIPTLSSDIGKFVTNTLAYNLTIKESEKIFNFWKNVVEDYNTKYNINNLISNVTAYANNLNAGVKWPDPQDLLIMSKTYKMYEIFSPNVELEAPMPIDDLNINMQDMPKDVEDVSIDMNDNRDINEGTAYDMTTYEYWLVYFANATLFTLLPLYWADGFDVTTPAGLLATLMPAVYIPICKPVVINLIHLQIVFGLAIRGIWVYPIVLCINQSNRDINALTPALVALEQARYYYQVGLEYIENGIPKLINGMISLLSEQNAGLRKAYNMYGTFASIIKAIPVEDKNLIKKEFKAALNDVKTTAWEEADNVSDKMQEKFDKASAKIKTDTRQVLTRLSKLGTGPEPM